MGMFANPDTSGVSDVLDRKALKALGVLPALPLDEPSDESSDDPAQSEPATVLRQSATVLRRSSRVRQPPPEHKDFNHPRTMPSKDAETIFLALSETQLQNITPKSYKSRQTVSSKTELLEKNGLEPTPAQNLCWLDGSSKSNIMDLLSKFKIFSQISSKHASSSEAIHERRVRL